MNAPAHTAAIPEQSHAVLGPDSLVWRYFGDIRVMFFLGTGLIMQTAHPTIGKAVGEHSDFRTDAYGRLERSLALLWPVIYNDAKGAAEYGQQLRERHRNIKGIGYDGKPYHALNPEPYLWVHMTAYDGFLTMAKAYGDELTDAQKEQLFQEWLQMGRQMGIRDKDMPADIPAYWAYWNKMIAERLQPNDTLDYLLREEYFLKRPKPPVNLLPGVVWATVRQPLGAVLWLSTRSAMPAAFRERFGVKWSAGDQRNFQRLMKVVNTVYKILPERARWLPVAWTAINDARQHPEKYSTAKYLEQQAA